MFVNFIDENSSEVALGKNGDTLHRIIVIPKAVPVGSVTLRMNESSCIIFDGTIHGTLPYTYEINNKCSGTWEITTTSNVKVIVVGDFS